jgi:hypothetical protein
MSRILSPAIDYNSPPSVDATLTADMRAFSNWRQERCEDFNTSVITSSAAAPATGVVCAVGEDLISLLVCAGGLIGEAHQASQRASAASDCNSSYPGLGRWEESTLPRGYGQ